MKSKMLKKAVFLLLCIIGNTMLAQITVSGTVSDASGPVPGVNVVVRGTTNGSVTDFDGKYTIENVAEDATLIFSFVGFASQQIDVNGRSTIDITLQEDAAALEEVVVIGYGAQSRAEVTGAISSVGSEEIAAIPVSTPEQALQGRAPGVTITNAGTPGSNPVVRIRGLGTFNNNDPLYVVDGVIVGNLSGISYQDIENINVLKDASTTAVYGAKGSNGVVIVTTKKGKAGKAQFSFSTFTGLQQVTQRYDLLNTEQYLQYAEEAFGVVPNRPEAFLQNQTNWQDEIFRTGFIQNYEFSASGGSENANFRLSGGYYEEEGALIETDFERYNVRANSNFTFGKFKLGQTLGLSFTTQHPERISGGRTVLEHAIKSAPYLPVFNADNLGGFQGPSSAADGQDAENPVRVQTLGEVLNRNTAIIGGIHAEYEILDGLTFKSQVSLDYFTSLNNNFFPSYNDDNLGATHSSPFATIQKNFSRGRTIILTNSLRYNKTFAELHNLEALLLFENTDETFEQVFAENRTEVTNEVEELIGDLPSVSSFSRDYIRRGYLGRLNYNYDQKYIFGASLRRDASSRFGPNNRWGWFYSFAAGWNIAKESFMEGSIVNNLKLRASWGTVGNDNIDNYLFNTTLSSDFFYIINGSQVSGSTPAGIPNPDVKWEETLQRNIGLDVGINNGQFTASLEYFFNESKDLLVNVPLPNSFGSNNPNLIQNVGAVDTKGFEINLGYSDYEGDFTWSANLNLGTTTNELTAISASNLGDDPSINIGGFFENELISRIAVGEPLFHFYGLETDGIYQNQAEIDAVLTANPDQTTVQPGDIRFVDQNGDGLINAEDRTIIGNPYPDLNYGLNLEASYKNFDINLFITGVAGNDVYNTNIFDLEGELRLFNTGVAVLDRWTPTNPSTTIPRVGGAPQNLSASDRFVEKGSYTRLKNITLGYNFSSDFFKKEIFSSLRLYISGQNLITITDYSGLDPEIAATNFAFGGANTEFGIDRGFYPRPQTFILGAQIKF